MSEGMLFDGDEGEKQSQARWMPWPTRSMNGSERELCGWAVENHGREIVLHAGN